MRLAVALGLSLVGAGCAATTQHEQAAQVAVGAEREAELAPSSSEPAVDSPRVSVAGAEDADYLGTLSREGLVAIVDRGLGRFLARMRIEPSLTAGKFAGFRVASLDPSWQDIGLRSGDVITRLNGYPIERPEQALTAFESLRTASELKVEFVRAGVPSNLRFRIE
jgi:hypothetical protein